MYTIKWVNGEKVLQFHEQFDVTKLGIRVSFYMYIYMLLQIAYVTKTEQKKKIIIFVLYNDTTIIRRV